MNVTILHGYSASNSGDGLLVDLAIALVQRNFGEDTAISVVASDPDSFKYLPHPRFDAPVMAAKGLGRVKEAVFLNQSYAGLADLLKKTDLIVGVGGGYMRSKSAFEHIKLKLGHAKQLETAILSKVPSVYLPQSIGPFHGDSDKIVGHYASAVRCSCAITVPRHCSMLARMSIAHRTSQCRRWLARSFSNPSSPAAPRRRRRCA